MDDTSTEATPMAATEISSAPVLTQHNELADSLPDVNMDDTPSEATPTAATESSTAPLLTRQVTGDSLFGGGGTRALTTLLIFLGLFSGHRGASTVVRDSASEQLKEWRDNWGYSLPVVAIDTIWNLASAVVSIVMLLWTAREQPNVPVRVWICGYALQCAVHVVLVWLEYRRRNQRASTAGSSLSDGDRSSNDDSRAPDATCVVKRIETVNTIALYFLWLVAFCWLIPNFEPYTAPLLFWLTVTFMATDFLFIAIVCLTDFLFYFAVCFFFSFVMAFLYFMRGHVGATEAEMNALPKYRFVVASATDPLGGRMVPFETNCPEFSDEQEVMLEDSDCCMCLLPYVNGTELVEFPCQHFFHVTCILKWLKVSRICPLCKNNAITQV